MVKIPSMIICNSVGVNNCVSIKKRKCFIPRCVTYMVSSKCQLPMINYNFGHNILELYNVLGQIRLTTNEMKCDI